MNIPRYRIVYTERNICICIFPLETNSGIVVSSIHSRLAARWSIPVAEWYRFSSLPFSSFAGLLSTGYGSLALSHRTVDLLEYVKVGGIRRIL